MTHKILFESDDIVLHYNQGTSDFLVVTFIGIGHEEETLTTYFGKPVFERHEISCIGVTTKVKNWYYSSNMTKALEIIQAHMKNFASTISFGLSAGAYAAIKYSSKLGIGTTIALAPQLSIDDQETEVLPEWAVLCTPEMRGMGIKSHDIYGDIFIFYDWTHRNDSFAAKTIEGYAETNQTAYVYKINIPSAGHIIYENIKSSKNLMTMISMAISDLPAHEKQKKFAKMMRVFRRRNTVNVYNKIIAGYLRHPRLTYDLLASKLFLDVSRIDKILRNDIVFYQLVTNLHAQGYRQFARKLLSAMIHYHATGEFLLSAMRDYENLSGHNVFLDHRGRTLGYSVKNRFFTSSNILWMEGNATPVSTAVVDGIEYPTVSYIGRKFFLTKLPTGLIGLESKPGNLKVAHFNQQCGLQASDETYLTIIDDIHFTWSKACLTWELFSVISV